VDWSAFAGALLGLLLLVGNRWIGAWMKRTFSGYRWSEGFYRFQVGLVGLVFLLAGIAGIILGAA